MTTMAYQITSLTVVYSTVYSDADQRKHQSSASLAFVWEFTGTDEFPAQRASYAEMFPFDDVIMPASNSLPGSVSSSASTVYFKSALERLP